MSGQLVMVVVPSASRAAAISFNTLFLAPPTATSPDETIATGDQEAFTHGPQLNYGADRIA